MYKELEFTIPICPVSVQHGARSAYRGGKVVRYSDNTKRQYQSDILSETKHLVPKQPLAGPLKIKLKFFMPRPDTFRGKKLPPGEVEAWSLGNAGSDWDNLSKGTQDGLMRAGFFKNDSQIWKCEGVERVFHEDGLFPRIKVTIYYQEKYQ